VELPLKASPRGLLKVASWSTATPEPLPSLMVGVAGTPASVAEPAIQVTALVVGLTWAMRWWPVSAR